MTQANAPTPMTFAKLVAQDRLPLIAQVAVRFAYVVTLWEQRRRSRIALSHLDQKLLNDIGVTRAQARKEAERNFWLG